MNEDMSVLVRVCEIIAATVAGFFWCTGASVGSKLVVR